MADINITFSRKLLSIQRATLTAEQKRRLKKTWVYGYQRGAGTWEFQAQDDHFYWSGDADNAYDARYKGTDAWLQKFYPEQER